MSWTAQTASTNAHLNRRGAYENVSIEMVTDDICQIMLTASLTEARVDSLAWQLAHLVDAVALFAEQEIDNPFNSFVLTFTQAWNMISVRKTARRKESAEIPTLPEFLGGSLDQDRD